MIQNKARNMPNRSRTNMWRLAIFSTRTNENHIRSPLGGGVYDFKLRKTLSQQCLRLRQVTQGRLQNLFRDRSFRILHFICKGSVAQRRPPESFPCPVHVPARADRKSSA